MASACAIDLIRLRCQDAVQSNGVGHGCFSRAGAPTTKRITTLWLATRPLFNTRASGRGPFPNKPVARMSARHAGQHRRFAHPGYLLAKSFEPIIQRSVGPFSKLAFKAALAAQPGKITCPRSGNDKPCRLDLAVLDDF